MALSKIHRVVDVFESGVSVVQLPDGTEFQILEVDTASGTSQDPVDFLINSIGLIFAADTSHNGDRIDFLIAFLEI